MALGRTQGDKTWFPVSLGQSPSRAAWVHRRSVGQPLDFRSDKRISAVIARMGAKEKLHVEMARDRRSDSDSECFHNQRSLSLVYFACRRGEALCRQS